MIAEICGHDSHDPLTKPDYLCVYVGPEASPSYRQPHRTVIAPVAGQDALRFFCIPGREQHRTFVLRQEACLQCSLNVCRRGNVSFLIL